jgi:hypothetical protein
MRYQYKRRGCTITVHPIGVVNGMYCIKVLTDCGGAVEEYAESVPVQALRTRADKNNAPIQRERDKFIEDARTRAQNRFQDTVDIEALNDGI